MLCGSLQLFDVFALIILYKKWRSLENQEDWEELEKMSVIMMKWKIQS